MSTYKPSAFGELARPRTVTAPLAGTAAGRWHFDVQVGPNFGARRIVKAYPVIVTNYTDKELYILLNRPGTADATDTVGTPGPMATLANWDLLIPVNSEYDVSSGGLVAISALSIFPAGGIATSIFGTHWDIKGIIEGGVQTVVT